MFLFILQCLNTNVLYFFSRNFLACWFLMWVSLFIFSSYRRLPEEEFAPQMGWVWKFYEKIKRKFLPPVNLHRNYMLKANFYDPIFRKRSPQTVSQRKRLVLHLRWHKNICVSWIFLKITVHIKLMLDTVLLHVTLNGLLHTPQAHRFCHSADLRWLFPKQTPTFMIA